MTNHHSRHRHAEARRLAALDAVRACGTDGATTDDVRDALDGTISPMSAITLLRSLEARGEIREVRRDGCRPVFACVR